MNNGVKRGAKVWIAKIIEMIFLIFMALFAAIPLLQVLLNSFPDRPGSKNHAVRSSKGMGFQ